MSQNYSSINSGWRGKQPRRKMDPRIKGLAFENGTEYSVFGMRRSNNILAVPVGEDIKHLIMSGARATKLSRADVLRNGLQIGVPELVRRVRGPRRTLAEYLDKYAGLPVVSREIVRPAKF